MRALGRVQQDGHMACLQAVAAQGDQGREPRLAYGPMERGLLLLLEMRRQVHGPRRQLKIGSSRSMASASRLALAAKQRRR
jgi:hypothetical protein